MRGVPSRSFLMVSRCSMMSLRSWSRSLYSAGMSERLASSLDLTASRATLHFSSSSLTTVRSAFLEEGGQRSRARERGAVEGGSGRRANGNRGGRPRPRWQAEAEVEQSNTLSCALAGDGGRWREIAARRAPKARSQPTIARPSASHPAPPTPRRHPATAPRDGTPRRHRPRRIRCVFAWHRASSSSG